jgi:hypothetical protein
LTGAVTVTFLESLQLNLIQLMKNVQIHEFASLTKAELKGTYNKCQLLKRPSLRGRLLCRALLAIRQRGLARHFANGSKRPTDTDGQNNLAEKEGVCKGPNPVSA